MELPASDINNMILCSINNRLSDIAAILKIFVYSQAVKKIDNDGELSDFINIIENLAREGYTTFEFTDDKINYHFDKLSYFRKEKNNHEN
ncbi:MAG: hypothetical protein IJ859_09375 [Synergistaceae bacterium]|nr:hypothetical protein [Synergistaceae bacterium]